MIIRFVMIIRGSNDERNTSYPGIGLDWTRTLAVRPIRGLINTRERKIDGCWLTCMLVHRRSRKTGRYHRSCKSLRLSGTAAPASARPPSLQQNRRKKNNIHQRSNARKYFARSVKKLSPLSPPLSLSLFRPFSIVRLSPLRLTPSLLVYARINRPVLKLCCRTPRMKMIFEGIFHAVDSWTCIFISIGPRAD